MSQKAPKSAKYVLSSSDDDDDDEVNSTCSQRILDSVFPGRKRRREKREQGEEKLR